MTATIPFDKMLPLVSVVYTKASRVSSEETQLAQYVALCLAASGRCAKTYLVGVHADAKRLGDRRLTTTASGAMALRSDGALLHSRQLSGELYEETDDWMKLGTCDLWLLVLETDVTLSVVEFLRKRLGQQDQDRPKRVVLSLQTTLRRLALLNAAYDCCSGVMCTCLCVVYTLWRHILM